MAARRAKKHHDEAHENSERWLLTYADMITLLMVLFIVLFSISRTDLAKFAKLREGLNNSFGTETPALAGTSGVLQGARVASGQGQLDAGSTTGITLEQAAAIEKQKLDDVKQNLEKELHKSGLDKKVQIQNEQRGLVITVLTDDVLFDLGKAELRPESRTLMAGIAGALKSVPNLIVIEGHTDNQPIRGGGLFATNWELSSARATTVVRHLIDSYGIAGARLSAQGFGEFRPIVPNDTQANKQLNRRVEVVVVSATDQPAPITTSTTAPELITPTGSPGTTISAPAPKEPSS